MYTWEESGGRSVTHLAGVLDELLPLRFELFAGNHVHFPVFVVVRDEKSSFGKVRQDRLHDDDRPSRVQLLVCLRLQAQCHKHVLQAVIKVRGARGLSPLL